MAKASRKWFYNSEAWRTVRRQALMRDHFTCYYCGQRATEVHHIVELDDNNVHDPNLSLNLNNLQSLCHDCHRRITMAEHGFKSLDCDLNYYFDEEGNLQRMNPPGGSK